MFAKKALSAALSTPAAADVYVEDVFSTYLFTGINSPLTITNGIDLDGEGGMVWMKSRSNVNDHYITDTTQTTGYYLESNTTDAIADPGSGNGITGYNSDGFDFGNSIKNLNTSGATTVSWTFRKAEKFFDVVTYSGTGSARTINHNLGSTPGCIIFKAYSGTSSTENWEVYHRSLGTSTYIRLNETGGSYSASQRVTALDSTTISLGTNTVVNGSGTSYVAYVFAHDAGGFGDAGDQSVIKCGSFTASSNLAVTLDWEPQWVLLKRTDSSQNWLLMDNMRGMPVGGSEALLRPNVSDAETASLNIIDPTATGFTVIDGGGLTMGGTYIYIAIRRGPMKTPEVGTEVFSAFAASSTGTPRTVTTGFPVDLSLNTTRTSARINNAMDRLRGGSTTSYVRLQTESTAAESSGGSQGIGFDNNTALIDNDWWSSYSDAIYWSFRRAPGFFDVVCYAGTGSAGATVSHNLGVAPELIITKVRNYTGEDWIVHYRDGSTITAGYLNKTDAFAASGSAPSTDLNSFTSTTYNRNTANRRVNSGSYNYVAYLFASVTGVSKVGTYTGNGSSQTINCGFTGGARFVLIKRTDSTGDWVVFDSARGIVSGNDPYLRLNSTAAEVTDKDAVDTDSTGFVVNETTGPNINTNSATYIYLAIA